ncbi:hypothetical protein V7x_00590 [Crateriforma conspicua]|uniref:Uncharacterized protein n=1 Tax=Crateriforma conspicua TaxID=2527996 RepID=A0A5C6FSL0_9PLAN|nr:hypothetical protein V7x_00590 [Crateriforma conspicua]
MVTRVQFFHPGFKVFTKRLIAGDTARRFDSEPIRPRPFDLSLTVLDQRYSTALLRAWERRLAFTGDAFCLGIANWRCHLLFNAALLILAIAFAWGVSFIGAIVLVCVLFDVVRDHQRSWDGPFTHLRALAWACLTLGVLNFLFVALCREGAVPEASLVRYSWGGVGLLLAWPTLFVVDALYCQRTQILASVSETITAIRYEVFLRATPALERFESLFADIDVSSELSNSVSAWSVVQPFLDALLPWQEESINSLRVTPRSEIE